MKVLRGWLLGSLVLSGCLEPKGPGLGREDTGVPTITGTKPASNETAFAKDGELEVTFSEVMDPRTLAPGIAIQTTDTVLAVTVTIPTPSGIEDDPNPVDIPYTVRARPISGALLAATKYDLVLRTLLADTEGNPLAQEIRVPFTTGP